MMSRTETMLQRTKYELQKIKIKLEMYISLREQCRELAGEESYCLWGYNVESG